MEATEITNLIFFCIFSVLFFPGVCIFLVRRKLEPIKSRGWQLAVLQMSVVFLDFCIRTAGNRVVLCYVTTLETLMLVPLWVYPYFIRSFVLWSKYNRQAGLTSPQKGPINFWFQKRPYLASLKYQLLYFFVIFFLFLGLATIMYFFDTPDVAEPLRSDFSEDVPNRCTTQHTLIMIGLETGLGIVIISFWVWLLWRVSDAFVIKRELTLVLMIAIPVFVIFACSSIPTLIFLQQSMLIVDLGQIASLIVTIHLPIYTSLKNEKILSKRSHSMELKSPEIRNEVDEVLGNEVLASSFEQYTKESWCFENLLFYIEIRKFKELPPDQINGAAKRIWENYLKPGAPTQINIDMTATEEIMELINAENFDKEMFSAAQHMVFNLLLDSVLPLWKSTANFKDALARANLKDRADSTSTGGISRAKSSTEIFEATPS